MDSINQFNYNFQNLNDITPKELYQLLKNLQGGELTLQNCFQTNNNLFLQDTSSLSAQAVKLYNTQIAQFTNELILKYILSLFELPKNIENFIEIFDNSANSDNSALNSNSKTDTVIQNMLNVLNLSRFLEEDSNFAVQKIIQIASNALKLQSVDIMPFREIFGFISNIENNFLSALPYNSLKELLLFYLPYGVDVFEKMYKNLSLAQKQNPYIEPKVVVLFESLNFSNFSCEIQEVDNILSINFCVDELFPFDKFKKIVNLLLSKANIKSVFNIKIKKREENKFEKQNFKIISYLTVGANVILAVHLIIKIVFKIDKDFSLSD